MQNRSSTLQLPRDGEDVAGEQKVWGQRDTTGTLSGREHGEEGWQLIRAEEAPTPQGPSRWVAEVVLVPCWSTASRMGLGEGVTTVYLWSSSSRQEVTWGAM
ncbi:hypothetical protein DUI87_27866 [Hirundo rustica rustica]|uniref:Uncharacterized protein n=1 Tax=Hirundo rustica rustica TaxID=333673 RepID=A0A3M0JA37_HIRRU|nr:hypothetical protein DUI87_27866 [Hirundo rustica rustica]